VINSQEGSVKVKQPGQGIKRATRMAKFFLIPVQTPNPPNVQKAPEVQIQSWSRVMWVDDFIQTRIDRIESLRSFVRRAIAITFGGHLGRQNRCGRGRHLFKIAAGSGTVAGLIITALQWRENGRSRILGRMVSGSRVSLSHHSSSRVRGLWSDPKKNKILSQGPLYN
jgi:hypothetical protein